MTRRLLTHTEAKQFYDRFGSKQDSQGWYEDMPVSHLLAHSQLKEAHAVVELGCGTGKLAAHLLKIALPNDASYHGYDISDVMVDLARERIRPWIERARVFQTDGSFELDRPDGSADRVIAAYLFDLLSPDDIDAGFREAWRMLAPGGLLCITGLGSPVSVMGMGVMALWRGAHWLRPTLVGGCRPLEMRPILEAHGFDLVERRTIEANGIASEIIIGRKPNA